jgi:hypothetical protein
LSLIRPNKVASSGAFLTVYGRGLRRGDRKEKGLCSLAGFVNSMANRRAGIRGGRCVPLDSRVRHVVLQIMYCSPTPSADRNDFKML